MHVDMGLIESPLGEATKAVIIRSRKMSEVGLRDSAY
jgi:hypothetical protein